MDYLKLILANTSIKGDKMEKETKETQVVVEVKELKRVISKLEKEVVSLKDRLQPVLRNESLEDANAEKDIDMVLVPFARELKEIRLRIDSLKTVIHIMLRELEL